MNANMRQNATRYVGQPIVAHHVDGTVYRGVLHSVCDDGLYIRPHGNTTYVANDALDANVGQADGAASVEAEEAFFPFFFLPFAFLAGFALGGSWWW